MRVKQVIVVRKDLKMRRGKECAQVAHASMAWLSNRLRVFEVGAHTGLSSAERVWIDGIFTKICVSIDGEQALRDVYETAKMAGLEAHLIVDSGLTEFKGVPTATCCGIGPDTDERIDPITRHLPLY